MLDILLTNNLDRQGIGHVMTMLGAPRLWVPKNSVAYPDYDVWLEKVEDQLSKDEKRTMAAFWGGKMVGLVVYQRHQTEKGTVEIKNISIEPEARGRHIASFALRNAEIEATQQDFPDCSRIVVDTKANNFDMIAFLESQSYRRMAEIDLYGLGAGRDIVYEKNITQGGVIL